jgi:hypothetical protein
MVTCAFFQARIDATKTQIVEIETAISSLLAGTIVSYELDTGQSKTKVTKMTIATLERWLESLMERLFRWEARLNGGGTSIAGPARGQ